MKFWDTSAVVPLLIQQPHTTTILAIFEADPGVVIWWSTHMEFESAVRRLARDGVLDPPGVLDARESFALLHEGAVEIQPGNQLRQRAVALLAEHPLRSADALQLSAAVTWIGDSIDGVFVTLDTRLGEAARAVGFTVLPTGSTQ